VLPTLRAETVFEDCVSSIGSATKVAEFRQAMHLIESAEADYLTAARSHILFGLPASRGGNDSILFGSLSKRDVKGLYSGQMVPAKKAARHHYDRLVVSSPQRRCPFCGFGRATTLDHFLNKANYPWLAIVPANLVPACKDCNQGKGTSRAVSANDQILHPYFEGSELVDDQWLFASVVQTIPLTIDYRAEPPRKWDRTLRRRAERHFADFDLKARFSIEAATELGPLRFTLKSLFAGAGRVGVKQHLTAVAVGEHGNFKNSWKTALYQALAECDWYIGGGYLLE
jgi:hypothetical protein